MMILLLLLRWRRRLRQLISAERLQREVARGRGAVGRLVGVRGTGHQRLRALKVPALGMGCGGEREHGWWRYSYSAGERDRAASGCAHLAAGAAEAACRKVYEGVEHGPLQRRREGGRGGAVRRRPHD